MTKNSSLNVTMLIFSAAAGIAVYAFGEALLSYMAYLPYTLQCGIYLVFVTVVCFAAIYISEKLKSGYYIPRGRVTFDSTCAKAAAILIPCAFAVGFLTQLLYGAVGVSHDYLKPAFQGTMVVCDTSGSMTASDPERAAVDAMVEYIDSVPLGEYLGVIVFSTDVNPLREYSILTSEEERQELIDLIMENVAYDGGTNTQGALMEAFSQMRGIEDKDWPGLMLLFSDGLAQYLDYNEIQRAAVGNIKNPRNGIPVNTVYFGSPFGGYEMSTIAQKTGGTYFHLGLDVDSDELREVFTRSRSSFSYERPHLLLVYIGAARASAVRAVAQAVLLSLWGLFTGVATVIFLNNNKLFTSFLIPRAIVAVVTSAVFAFILANAGLNIGMPARALLALGICLLYLPTYSWGASAHRL